MADPEQTFPEGAQVRLKSGGPVMTIENYGEYMGSFKYYCKWYDQKTNDYKGETFKESMLERMD